MHLLLLQTVAVVEQALVEVLLEDLVEEALVTQHQAEVQLKETHLQEQVTEIQAEVPTVLTKDQAVAEVLDKQELLYQALVQEALEETEDKAQ
jgi:hypothetical protein